MPQSAVFNASSVMGIPTETTGDTQNTRDLGTGVPKTRGYPKHGDTQITVTVIVSLLIKSPASGSSDLIYNNWKSNKTTYKSYNSIMIKKKN